MLQEPCTSGAHTTTNFETLGGDVVAGGVMILNGSFIFLERCSALCAIINSTPSKSKKGVLLVCTLSFRRGEVCGIDVITVGGDL